MFKDLAKTEEDLLKSVVVITTDGGPDENPRYPYSYFSCYRNFR